MARKLLSFFHAALSPFPAVLTEAPQLIRRRGRSQTGGLACRSAERVRACYPFESCGNRSPSPFRPMSSRGQRSNAMITTNSSWLGVILAAGFMSVLVGCVTGDLDDVTPYKQEAGNGLCHLKLQPIGPTDPARPTQSRSGDFIDYYGPCDGPSTAEQIRKQRRFERFRFGRDYMPG